MMPCFNKSYQLNIILMCWR